MLFPPTDGAKSQPLGHHSMADLLFMIGYSSIGYIGETWVDGAIYLLAGSETIRCRFSIQQLRIQPQLIARVEYRHHKADITIFSHCYTLQDVDSLCNTIIGRTSQLAMTWNLEPPTLLWPSSGPTKEHSRNKIPFHRKSGLCILGYYPGPAPHNPVQYHKAFSYVTVD